MQILNRMREWREENKQLGLETTISDNWTHEQRESFLLNWFDESGIIEATRGEKHTNDEMMNEDLCTSD